MTHMFKTNCGISKRMLLIFYINICNFHFTANIQKYKAKYLISSIRLDKNENSKNCDENSTTRHINSKGDSFDKVIINLSIF